MAERSPQDIIRIVLRGMCGYESVSSLCQAEDITPRQYDLWQRNFLQACKQWTRDDADRRGLGDFDDEDEFYHLVATTADDIADRAEDRLTTGWLAEQASQTFDFATQ